MNCTQSYIYNSIYGTYVGIQVELCDNQDKSIIKIFIYYHVKDNGFYYHDDSKFLDTTVNYTKHTGILVERDQFQDSKTGIS